MKKSIHLSKNQSVEVDASAGWLLEYRNQFGKDILPDLLPIGEAITALVLRTLKNITPGTETDQIMAEVVDGMDEETLDEAFVTLSTLEVLTLFNVVWAMAKNNSRDFPDPETWMKSIEYFPVDSVTKDVFGLIGASLISSKNWERLKDLWHVLHPEKDDAKTN